MKTKILSQKQFLIILLVVIAGFIGGFYLKNVSGKQILKSSGGCGQYSTKDGYTGCMSLTNGKNKRCKFKVDNKINEETQQMEFQYTCVEK